MKKGIYSFLLQILKISLAVGLFIYLIVSGRVDVQKIGRAFSSSPWIFLSLIMMSVSFFITTWRWRLLLLSQGMALSFKKTLKLVFIGYFFNSVIPGTVSGDIVKAYYLSKNEKNKITATLSVIMDRFIGLVSLLVIAFFAVLFNYSFIQSIAPLKALSHVIIVGFGLSGVAFSFFLIKKDFSVSEKWPLFLRRLIQAFWSYRKCLDKVFMAGMLTCLSFSANVVLYYSAVRALGENSLPIIQYFFLLPLGMFITAIPIAPLGLGVGQGIFLKLFQWTYGKPVTTGADMITLVQMLLLFWALIGFVVYLFDTEKAPQDLAYEQS